jgi:hypothetical protein
MGWNFSVGNIENFLTTMVLNFFFKKDIFPFLFIWKLTEHIPNLKLFKILTYDKKRHLKVVQLNQFLWMGITIEELSKTC